MIVGTAIYIHKDLGPELLESVYETTLMKLLKKGVLTEFFLPLCS